MPTCAEGSSVPVMGNTVNGIFWVLWFLLGVLCIWRVLILLVSLLCTRLGLHFCLVEILLSVFWGLIFWHFRAGRARHPGPPSQPRHVSLEFHNVGGWLTHGDIALDAGVDFLATAEHRLIPARVRSQWSRLSG